MTRLISSSLVLSSLTVFACGGGSGGSAADEPMEQSGGSASMPSDSGSSGKTTKDETPDEMPDETPDEMPVEVDDVAPAVITVSPLSGAQGVLRQEVIVVEFSEAMDQAATEQAYVSEALPADAVTFSWDADGKQLTITPNEELEYGIGLDAESAVAKEYSYTISTDARDLAGNPLVQDEGVSFRTGRLILQETPLVQQFSGSINKATKVVTPNFGAGDDVNDVAYRGFVSFELPVVPEDRLELLVLLETKQVLATPDAFTDLGAVRVATGSFDNETSLLAISMELSLGVLSSAMDVGLRQLDVSAAVEPLLVDGAAAAQFVFEFEKATDEDKAADGAFFEPASTRLLTGYVIE